MARRGGQSWEKRQREMAKREKAAAKAARKHDRSEGDPDDDTEAPDENALLERFRELSERHGAGAIDDDEFSEGKKEIFEALGIPVE